jgi:hypothetical protein
VEKVLKKTIQSDPKAICVKTLTVMENYKPPSATSTITVIPQETPLRNPAWSISLFPSTKPISLSLRNSSKSQSNNTPIKWLTKIRPLEAQVIWLCLISRQHTFATSQISKTFCQTSSLKKWGDKMVLNTQINHNRKKNCIQTAWAN